MYKFWRGKFYYAGTASKGYTNCHNLKDAVFEKFGEGHKPNQYLEEYHWYGNKTGIRLEYSEISEVCKLHMFSVQLFHKTQDYEKQKAKEGAEKGF